MVETFTCSHCGQVLPLERRTEFDDKILCNTCIGGLTVVCDHCEGLIWRQDDCGDSGITLCAHCRDNHYTECCDCGRLTANDELHYLNDDDDEGYCDSCWHEHGEKGVIQSYYYKPAPVFHGEGTCYFGVELEMDGGGELDSKARQLLAVVNESCPTRLYIKHDGSLDEGLEAVTNPMTLDYHMHQMPWAALLRTAVELGYSSHLARTCGLHVHVNRTAFGATEAEQEDVIARILFFVENHWNELLRFSRRTQHQMEQWAARYGRKDDPKAVLDHAKHNQFERYTCVNLTNRETVEFRLFRGSLKLNTVLATLQMTDRICEVARNLSDHEIQNLTWSEFVAGCSFPELVQYLKERRLYVSDPVATVDEV